MSKKYQGNKVEINPLWENVKLLFLTTTTSNFALDIKAKPIFLFVYENNLYFGMCNYEFHFLENYEDFTMKNGNIFNSFLPT